MGWEEGYVYVFGRKPITKRFVLSQLSRIFDPLGWLAPVTIQGKCFIQKLWKLQMTWDVELESNLANWWMEYAKGLSYLEEISISRWTGCSKGIMELHGFCDASEKAHAAAVYTKVGGRVTLLAAKSKVIWSKKITTHAWSDSQITIAWIQNKRSKDKFVTTRVKEINKLIPNVKWNYVKSEENPADLASRGISPQALKMCEIWWRGPNWLAIDAQHWPTQKESEIVVVFTLIKSEVLQVKPSFIEVFIDRQTS